MMAMPSGASAISTSHRWMRNPFAGQPFEGGAGPGSGGRVGGKGGGHVPLAHDHLEGLQCFIHRLAHGTSFRPGSMAVQELDDRDGRESSPASVEHHGGTRVGRTRPVPIRRDRAGAADRRFRRAFTGCQAGGSSSSAHRCGRWRGGGRWRRGQTELERFRSSRSRLIMIAGGFEGALKPAALIDLVRRPPREIRGSKARWATALTLINSLGAV